MTFTREEMMQSYEKVSFCRLYEKHFEDGALSGAILGFSHVALAEEATFAAELTELGPHDWLFPNNVRALSLQAQIFGVREFTSEYNARVGGPNHGMASAGHVYSREKRHGPCFALLGAQSGVATGMALAMKLNKEPGCVVTCMGDGTTEEGLVSESANFAKIRSLPMVFLVRNNGFGMGMAADKHSGVTVPERMAGFGIPCVSVDGEDVLAVRAAVREALATARAGKPNAVEVKTVRWTGHFVGDPQPYRPKEEVANARNFDPYKKYRAYLVDNKVATLEELDAIDKKNLDIIDDAFSYALALPMNDKEYLCEENAKNLYVPY